MVWLRPPRLLSALVSWVSFARLFRPKSQPPYDYQDEKTWAIAGEPKDSYIWQNWNGAGKTYLVR